MNIKHFGAFSIIFGLCLTTLPHCPANDEEIKHDVVYGNVEGTELHMDIAIPTKKDQPVPCIVVIHGGAWRQGNKSMHLEEIKRFAKHGYVAASIEYRFCPKHRFPAQIEDAKCAIRYLRAHAKQYGINPERIGAMGFSAGAHLSMMLGTMDRQDGFEGQGGWPDESSKVQAVVSFFGPTQLDANDIPDTSLPLVHDFIGDSKEKKADAYRQASPLTYVDSGDAPMLLFQGTRDVLVPYSQAIKMVTAMTRSNIPGRVEFLINANHGWYGDELNETIDGTLRFFRKHLPIEK
jgi:acetyl esterase/lipase